MKDNQNGTRVEDTRWQDKRLSTPSHCDKCHKPFVWAGDMPDGGFQLESEPWCTCGLKRCDHCKQIIK